MAGPDSAAAIGPEFKTLLTAQEAFPELERLFLSAKSEIVLCFRIFDPWTSLRSPEAKAIGTTWFDLLVHCLERGVRVSITVSDFDPMVWADGHQSAWATVRALVAAGEASGRPDLLDAQTSMHPARLGLLPRLVLWPRTYMELRKTVTRVNKRPPAARAKFVSETPYLRQHLRLKDEVLTARLWPVPVLYPATHHQKLAVFDGQQLYIGGLDLDERRYDTPSHQQEAAETWHDFQVSLSGPAARDALEHLHSFKAVTHGDDPPKLTSLLRTISQRRKQDRFAMSPKPRVNEIVEAHMQNASNAQTLIYMESQYFRDRQFARHLAQQAQSKPALRMILILPAAPEDVAFASDPGSDARYGEYLQAKSVAIIREAYGERLLIGAPAQPRAVKQRGRGTLYGAPLIYLHAKVSIFDDTSAIVSSANLNGRSLRWDTEAGVRLTDPAKVQAIRQACFEHWLGAQSEKAYFQTATAQPLWAKRAYSNAQVPPADRQGFVLPYASRPAKRFGRNLPGIPEEMV